MAKEAQARIKINRLLEDAGWRFEQTEAGPANIALELHTTISRKQLEALGSDFEKAEHGFVDFMLLDSAGFPLVVLEAKREDRSPLDGKEQARGYARSLNVHFVILSNGNLHYFWDLRRGNPFIVTQFPTPEAIAEYAPYQPDMQALARHPVDNDYILKTQFPAYASDPRWATPEGQREMCEELELTRLRDYQVEAVHALQKATASGSDRYLFEMATGTGKTPVAAAVIKLFLRTQNARRVLFLVDRLELENQARRSFTKLLKSDYTTCVYKENRDDWRKAEIVVSTVQSLFAGDRYRRLFAPTDFDLVISDEAHRSINGKVRAVFEYFFGYKLGLTATPKDYLKNLDPKRLAERDPRVVERRLLNDTYRTFGCGSGDPTFRYSLVDGVRDGFLVNPTVVDARTHITTQLLSDQGYAVAETNEDGEEEERVFRSTDYEKKLFSPRTNRAFCIAFLDNALKDPLSQEIGKSIFFCVSQRHASAITQILNEEAAKRWPHRYQSDFAVQVTSNIPGAQSFAAHFANNNLNGQTKWLHAYRSSKTRVCVTVGMMTTGYDCQDILNLCLARPIFSPSDFIQMKGRGTRTFDFKLTAVIDGQKEHMSVAKKRYKLFDFFANCEYFEEKYNYDEVLELPAGGGTGGNGKRRTDETAGDEVHLDTPDPMETIAETAIGPSGMRVDTQFFQQVRDEVLADPVARERYEQGDIAAAEAHVRETYFSSPDDPDKLRKVEKALRLDRRLSIREFLDFVFGRTSRLKKKEELLEEEVARFVSLYHPDASELPAIRTFMKAYMEDGHVRQLVDGRQYAALATNPRLTLADVQAAGRWRDIIPDYVKDYINLNTYM